MRAVHRRRLELELWAKEHCLTPQICSPDDWPDASRLNANGVTPLRHGDHLVGLSGVYAALNGIRLVSARHHAWTDRCEQQLLATAWNWLASRGEIRPDRGIRVGQWQRLVDALTFAFSRKQGQLIEVIQPWRLRSPDRLEFFATIERLIVSRHAVLSMFTGAHYTVIRGYTPMSLVLFDSGYCEWIKKTSTDVNGDWPTSRHRIVPSATLALARRF
jgi:hypothetical protein